MALLTYHERRGDQTGAPCAATVRAARALAELSRRNALNPLMFSAATDEVGCWSRPCNVG